MALKAADIVKKKGADKDKRSKSDALIDWIGGRREHIKKGLTAKGRSRIATEARHGHKFAKNKKNSFKNVEAKAEKEYGNKETAEKVAGSIFWKNRGK